MSAALVLPSDLVIESLPRKRFTREEVERLIDEGFFDGQRYELIDGDLIDKMGQNPPHASAIRRINVWLLRVFGAGRIQMQLPVEASGKDRERSLPEPDIALFAEEKAEYDRRHPRGDELLLVVEVSDTTLRFDLSRKAALYAAAGVPEYWVVDLVHRQLVAHRQSDGSSYRRIELFSEADSVSLESLPETVTVAALLPKRD